MPRKTSSTLTDAELRLMQALWEHGAMTVSEVVDALPKQDKVAYSTVLTTLRILERKKYVRHHERGRAYVYEAVVAREDAQRSTVRHLVSRFFDDSPAALVLNLIENESLDADELARVKELIQEAESDD